jgi:hypothetical protein
VTFDQFNSFQDALLEEVRGMAKTKGKEYANGEDRFGNFNRLAQRLKISREHVLYVYLGKHLDGIETRLVTGQTFSAEGTRGRIVDAITYLTLLAGMLEEESREGVRR